MTDVWTSAGVIVALLLVSATGWQRLDPLIALGSGSPHLHHRDAPDPAVRERPHGQALPAAEEQQRAECILERLRAEGFDYHALRTRQSGHRRFVYFHLLVPGAWSVEKGHDLMERIEDEIRASVPHATVIAHLEPVEQPSSYEDLDLDR